MLAFRYLLFNSYSVAILILDLFKKKKKKKKKRIFSRLLPFVNTVCQWKKKSILKTDFKINSYFQFIFIVELDRWRSGKKNSRRANFEILRSNPKRLGSIETTYLTDTISFDFPEVSPPFFLPLLSFIATFLFQFYQTSTSPEGYHKMNG